MNVQSATGNISFRSDNDAGAAPRILEALAACNAGSAYPYGADDWTRGAEAQLGRVFERKLGVLLVNTGTAANSLAVAAMTPPGAVCSATGWRISIPTNAAHRSSSVRA